LNGLPKVSINGATGPFKFRPAVTKDGKPGGFDADQKPFIYIVQHGKFTLYAEKPEAKAPAAKKPSAKK
jgi:branched-chain amino acid transport system substrate-binding protein